MANPFVHLELNTPDTAKTKEFYGKLFGWTFDDNDMGGGMVYSTFKTDGGPGGGIYTHPGAPNQWIAYVGVDDIHTATAKARSLGAKVEVEAKEVPHMGWFTVLTDPTGATVALWQPVSK